MWEPWTGCYKISDGCTNCYFYGPHAKRCSQNIIQKTDKFDQPIRKTKKANATLKGIKSLPPALQLIFFFPKQMNGAMKFGLSLRKELI